MTIRPYEKIRLEDESGVRRITLCNPERRNALGPQMVNELLHVLQDAAGDPTLRVIVLTGDGSAFSAGADFTQSSADRTVPQKGDFADLLLAMTRIEKPIVARVNGPAMGGGLGLVAASTFAIGDEGAMLGTPEIHVGLFPMMIMAVLSRFVPRRKLVEMMLLGQKMTAAAAVEVGLLNRVVPTQELDEAVRAITDEIRNKSPIAVALGLRAFAEQDDLDLETSLPLLRERLGECMTTEDAREGLMAFLEKRVPVWKGR